MLLHLHDYDSAFNPAMPKVKGTVAANSKATSFEIEMIVDSGADITMIPLSILKMMRARKSGKTNLKGIAGFSYTTDTYTILIGLGNADPFYLEVVGTQNITDPILGRDVLNQYEVLLNGPASTVSISI